ncbi:MAG: diadenylate cyclase CdaA [Deltaproteobacteria bacterium]
MSVLAQLEQLRADPVFRWVTAAVDVLLVAALIYRVLMLIKGTRAVSVLLGVLLLIGSDLVARELGLRTLAWMLGRFLTYGLAFGLIVLFQDEIRRGLAQLGRNSFLAHDARLVELGVIEELVVASEAMASRRVGALIVLERSADLTPFAEAGVRLDARLSQEALRTLFHPGSPLHDGAAIVQGNRISAARCVLPLGEPPTDRELGTRHQAALTLSSQLDAAAIVISEERGEIALAVDGKLQRGLDADSLRRLLLLRVEPPPAKRAQAAFLGPSSGHSNVAEASQVKGRPA